MSRIEVLARRPKQTIAVLALVLLAVAVAIGSGANFTAQASNPSNTFTAGALSIGNTPSTAILSVSGWKPGDTTTGTVDIQNTGTISGAFTVTATSIVDTPASPGLSSKIDLVVKDCGDFSSGTPTCDGGDPVKYSGTLATMTGNSALGTFAANEKHRYEFTATFNSSAGNTYQGANTTATFQWDATQS